MLERGGQFPAGQQLGAGLVLRGHLLLQEAHPTGHLDVDGVSEADDASLPVGTDGALRPFLAPVFATARAEKLMPERPAISHMRAARPSNSTGSSMDSFGFEPLKTTSSSSARTASSSSTSGSSVFTKHWTRHTSSCSPVARSVTNFGRIGDCGLSGWVRSSPRMIAAVSKVMADVSTGIVRMGLRLLPPSAYLMR
ncbi:MAG: hypothetical protein GEV08_16860 [Acidimicrobiia bacterium]|nr:hypothetical protein [Acidimicrobiia bacterium]